MMKDLEIPFTAKEITAFGGVSLLYKMLDNCHFKEVLSSVDYLNRVPIAARVLSN